MSPSTIEQRQAGEQEVLQPVRLPERRLGFFGYLLRYLRRAAAYAVFALAALLVWVIVSPLLPNKYAFPPQLSSGNGGGSAATTAPPPPRPANIPARIPSWAWSMEKWFNKVPANRGPRPAAAPRRLPHWFWVWRKWRLAVEKH